MNSPSFNLVLLKAPPFDAPYVLDDTVQSVSRLLSLAGFETSISFNRVDTSRINIIFGSQMPQTPALAQIRQTAPIESTIIFNTEQLGGESHWISDEYLSFLGSYVTLDYSIGNIDFLRKYNQNARCVEFPLIPDDRFRYDFEHDRAVTTIKFDLAFYGSSGLGNRMLKLQELARKNLRIKCFSGAFGVNVSPQILDCAAVLNIHGFKSGIFEAIRCLRPAALGIPIISEISTHSRIASWEDSGVIFIDDEDFSDSVSACLRDQNLLLAASRRLRAFVDDPKWPSLAKEAIEQAVFLLSNH